MVGETTRSGLKAKGELLVMSSRKSNGKTLSAMVGSSAKSKGASLPTGRDYQSAGNAVKGRDERQQRAPLTAFPAPCPRLHFFSLTPAVVVIDGMTSFVKRDIRLRLTVFQRKTA